VIIQQNRIKFNKNHANKAVKPFQIILVRSIAQQISTIQIPIVKKVYLNFPLKDKAIKHEE
jgi:hypothetical protein